MDFDPSRVTSNPFVVGGLGALVTALKFMPGSTWIERAANVAAGSLSAGYGTPALVQWLQMDSPGYINAAAFVVGLLGMSLIASILDGIKGTNFAKIFTSWLSRRGNDERTP